MTLIFLKEETVVPFLLCQDADELAHSPTAFDKHVNVNCKSV